MSKSSLEAAAEAAARVNAMLIAKGKLKLPPTQLKPKIGTVAAGRTGSGDLITAEVDINDAPLSARNLLTRGHIQDEICKYSGAAISTRGRYMTLDERQTIASSESRPLYLHVQASAQEAVDLAVRRIQEIINQHVIASGGIKGPTVGNVTYPSPNTNGTVPSLISVTSPPLSSGPHFVQDKVFIGLEHTPATYPVREKILGPGGSFLQHIRTETGATVTLRGKGSGFIEPTSGREAFEPLYIHITHPKLEGLQAAKALAINLVETTHVEYAQWQQQQSVLQPLTSVVIPQGTPVAYQNQVVMAPAVIPVSASTLGNASSIVTARLPVSAASVPGVALPASVSSLVQTPVSLSGITGVPPVSVVTSIPVSVQGIPSQAVITYPTTYVANHNPVIARAAASAASIIGVTSHIPVSSSYTAVSSQPTIVSSQPAALTVSQYPTSIQPLTFSQPLTYAAVPPPSTHLTQQSIQHSAVVPAQNTVNYSAVPPPHPSSTPSANAVAVAPISASAVIQAVSTAYPHLYYPRIDMEQTKRKFCETQEDKSRIADLTHSLQESNSNHPTDIGAQRMNSLRKNVPSSQDRELMPPPRLPIKDLQGSGKQPEINEPEKKRLKGALVGLASIYGSDDSSDDESPIGSPSSKLTSIDSSSAYAKSYASTHANKPLM